MRHRIETRNPRELTLKMRQLLCVKSPWDIREVEGVMVFFGANHHDERGTKYASYPVEDYAETMNMLSLYGLVEGKVNDHGNRAIWSLTQYGILNREILISKDQWEYGNSKTDNTQRSSVVV